MTFKVGETVIVTEGDVNRVGVILDKFTVSKRVVYDVLLENRSAVCMIGTKATDSAYINQHLSGLLCYSGMIETTIPYKHMLDNDLLPITKS
jgi:hypothetical protein